MSFQRLCIIAFVLLRGGLLPSGSASELLETALEVRSLSREEAELGQPVDLTGKVIFSDPPATVFIQDETAGTFFRLDGAQSPEPGDLVRVRGRTFPGLYLSGIEEVTFEVLRHGELPEAQVANLEDLRSGRFHYQRVVVEGIVRTVTPDDEGASVARVDLGSGIVEIHVEASPEENSHLPNSRVRISGLAAGHINSRRQLVGPYLRCRAWSEIEVQKKAPPLNSIQPISAEELLNFDIRGQGGHLVRVKGVVLAAFRGGDVFLRSEAGSISVQLLDVGFDLDPGDHLDVAGFPEMARFSATMMDAVVIDHQPGTGPPEPVVVSVPELTNGDEDGNLVTVTAKVTDWYRTKGGGELVLQEGDLSLRALTPALPDPESLVAGAQLRVTGICQVESTRGTEYQTSPESVIMRVRSKEDIRIVGAPSWWTVKRLTLVLIVLLAAILLTGLWIALLRRQVRLQTDAIRRGIETEAAFEERQRIAREFHDTLEQDLAGLSLRLDAAGARETNEKQRGLIEASRSLVTRIQTETRNLVSDLRSAPDDNQLSLESALGELGSPVGAEVGPAVRLEVGEIPNLPPRIAHHLKMIAQEAVTNALKHSRADTIVIRVRISDDGSALLLDISDNGTGFEVDRETRGKSGHFGCMGIRERGRKIGAEVTWLSEPGQGTTVHVELSLSDIIQLSDNS